MYTVITILIIIVCVLLALVVMVQNAKGGGLASGFASSGQIMGVQKTTDFIEKLTWGLALTLVVLCLAASFALPNKEQRNIGSSMQEQIDNAGSSASQKAPQKAPAKAPAQQQPQPATPAPQGK
ncbi:MAG: preprotein translocase subunit SecG [Bacteroidota bacterium]